MLDLPAGQYLLAEEAADRLGLSPRMMRQACAAGRIAGAVPLARPGALQSRLWLIPVAALDAWYASRRGRGRPRKAQPVA